MNPVQRAPAFRLDGLVLGINDEPVAGAQVVLRGDDVRTALTDRGGSFMLEGLAAGPFQAFARRGDLYGGPVSVNPAWMRDPVVIRLRAGATVEVQVHTPQGTPPPARARIELRGPSVIRGSTDPSGRARLSAVPPGPAILVVQAPGFAITRKLLDVPQALTRPFRVRVVLVRSVGITGRVVDEDRVPIQGARVTATDAAALTRLTDPGLDGRSTDASGHFELPPVSPGPYRIVARHPGYQDAVSRRISIDGRAAVEDVELVMAAGATISGEVVSADGSHAAWAVVKFVYEDQTSLFSSTLDGMVHRAISADARGRFMLHGLPRSQVSLLAMSDSAVSEVESVDLSATPVERGVVLRLACVQGISGLVVDRLGSPVHDAQVLAEADEVAGPSSVTGLRESAATITDGGGQFSFGNLTEGSYQLYASRSLVTYQQRLSAGVKARTGDAGVRLMVSNSGGVLTGRVVYIDGGNPTWFSVAFEHPPGVPVKSEDGSFEIAGLPAGEHTVFIHGRSFSYAQVNGVQIRPGQTTDIGVVQVVRGRFIAGKVVDGAGDPVGGARVVCGLGVMSDGSHLRVDSGLASDETLEVKTFETGPDGAFAFHGVGLGPRMLVADHLVEGRSEPLVIQPGDKSVGEFVLELRRTASVVGRVTCGGDPAARASVTASAAGVGNYLVKVGADREGVYSIDRVAPGPTVIRAEVRDENSRSLRSGSAAADLKEGEHHRIDIHIPIGIVSLIVEVKPESSARVDLAPIHLLQGDVVARTAAMLNASEEATPGVSTRAFWAPGRPARLDGLSPGHYSVCVVPLEGAVEDQAFVTWMKKNLNRIRAHCSTLEVESSPSVQSFTVTVPGMQLLGE